MKKGSKNIQKKAQDSLWATLIGTIYFIVFCVIASLGYLIFEDQIHSYFNQKNYTTEELELLSKKAMIKQSLEDEEANWDKIEKGIHIRTGFHDDPDLKVVIATCTSCHSAKLITQNKATRSGWKSMIRWMQETQGLPDLGKTEPVILDYLAKYYAPTNTGRRKNIDVESIKWFVLDVKETPQ